MDEIRRKKILWVSHLVPYPPKGGVLQRAYNLILQVSQHHDVYLFAFNQNRLLVDSLPDSKDPMSDAVEKLSSICKAIKVVPIESESRRFGKIRLALRSLISLKGYTERWLYSSAAESALAEFAADVQFDVVHFDTISLAHLRNVVPGKSAMLDHHNIESAMLFRRAEKEGSWVKRIYFYQEALKLRRYEKEVCKVFDCHIVCSDEDGKRLHEIDPSLDIRLVPNGVDVDYFKGSNEVRSDELIFAGGLSWYPNLDAMCFFAKEVWPLLKVRRPGLVMNLIGKNPSAELVDLGKADSDFIVHGFVDDVRVFANRSKVYVCPIRDGGGTKLKVLDAFALGVPMVAHPLAVEGIDVNKDLHVSLATTPEEFVDKIIQLLDDETARNRMSAAARSLVEEKYSFKSIGRNLSSIYCEMSAS